MYVHMSITVTVFFCYAYMLQFGNGNFEITVDEDCNNHVCIVSHAPLFRHDHCFCHCDVLLTADCAA